MTAVDQYPRSRVDDFVALNKDGVMLGTCVCADLETGDPGWPFAPWVRTDDPESNDDDGFFAALQELVAYAFEESARIKKEGRLFLGWYEKPVRSSRGILQEVQSLLQKYRSELVRQSRLLDQGGRA
jgi:hypothetical protein